MPPGEKGPTGDDWTRVFRDSAPYLGIGLSLAITLLVSLLGGYWLDEKLKTQPWFFLLGGLFGLFAAGYHFYKTVTARKP